MLRERFSQHLQDLFVFGEVSADELNGMLEVAPGTVEGWLAGCMSPTIRDLENLSAVTGLAPEYWVNPPWRPTHAIRPASSWKCLLAMRHGNRLLLEDEYCFGHPSLGLTVDEFCFVRNRFGVRTGILTDLRGGAVRPQDDGRGIDRKGWT